jgi:hypothetical protein
MRKIAVFVAAAVLLVLLLPTAVYAQPPALSDAFEGNVLINGVAAANGTSVSGP